MWLKESCVASVRCHYGGQHTPSPAADIKAILPTARPLQATVTVRQPLEDLSCCCFPTTQCWEGACETAPQTRELAADPDSRTLMMEETNWLYNIILWLPHVGYHVSMLLGTHTSLHVCALHTCTQKRTLNVKINKLRLSVQYEWWSFKSSQYLWFAWRLWLQLHPRSQMEWTLRFKSS